MSMGIPQRYQTLARFPDQRVAIDTSPACSLTLHGPRPPSPPYKGRFFTGSQVFAPPSPWQGEGEWGAPNDARRRSFAWRPFLIDVIRKSWRHGFPVLRLNHSRTAPCQRPHDSSRDERWTRQHAGESPLCDCGKVGVPFGERCWIGLFTRLIDRAFVDDLAVVHV